MSVVLFDGFELLDVFGPVELFGMVPGKVDVEFVGPQAGAVASGQGAQAIATSGYAAAAPADIVLVPGGRGTRRLVADGRFLSWLRGWAGSASLVTSVCTGSALLAAAGLLDGYDATSNKRAFDWVRTHGEDVRWIRRARWVEDRDRWTSSGVAAGMDMAVALLGCLFGDAVAREAASRAELDVHGDPSWDPFAQTADPPPPGRTGDSPAEPADGSGLPARPATGARATSHPGF